MGHDKDKKMPFSERRKYQRFSRNYMLNYHDAANPDKKYSVSQLKNISQGGMCFITDDPFAPQTKLILELNTPYIAETTFLEGIVVASDEKIKGMIYETRLEFKNLSPESEFILNKMMEYFKSGDKK